MGRRSSPPRCSGWRSASARPGGWASRTGWRAGTRRAGGKRTRKNASEFLETPLEELSSNPRNPRKGFTGPKFDELLASIKEKGVIEPIIVRTKKAGGRNYEIVAGERPP